MSPITVLSRLGSVVTCGNNMRDEGNTIGITPSPSQARGIHYHLGLRLFYQSVGKLRRNSTIVIRTPALTPFCSRSLVAIDNHTPRFTSPPSEFLFPILVIAPSSKSIYIDKGVEQVDK